MSSAEKLLTKYKQNVLNSLPEEDKEIIDAYIHTEVKRIHNNKSFFGTFKDMIIGTILVSVIISVTVVGFTAIHDASAYTNGYQDAEVYFSEQVDEMSEQQIKEASSELEKRIESLEESLELSKDSFEERQRELEGKIADKQLQIDAFQKEKDAYCSIGNSSRTVVSSPITKPGVVK